MREAVVSYEVQATDDEKQLALLMGLDDVLGELLEFHGWNPDDLLDRCGDVIENIADELAQATEED